MSLTWAKKHNRICYSVPKVYLQSNLTAYFNEDTMASYSTMLGNIFRISYPNLDNGTASDLGAAVVGFEIDMVTEALRYQESLGAEADSPVSATTQDRLLILSMQTKS